MIEEVECFLFSALVLGHLRDQKGNTWRREVVQMYTIEVTLSELKKRDATCHLLSLFPSAFCLHPIQASGYHRKPISNLCKCILLHLKKYMYLYVDDRYPGMDYQKLISDPYQRVYYYLNLYDTKKNLDSCVYDVSCIIDDSSKFIRLILR